MYARSSRVYHDTVVSCSSNLHRVYCKDLIFVQGGSADLLRSMNAVSTLYLFPSTYTVTVKNIVEALAICPGTDAFLSVPYILKMLAESKDGLEMLRTMNLVSTGGAPLPEARE